MSPHNKKKNSSGVENTGLKFDFKGSHLLGVILTYTFVLLLPAAAFRYWDVNYNKKVNAPFAQEIVNPFTANTATNSGQVAGVEVQVPLDESANESYLNQEISADATSGEEVKSATTGQVAGVSTNSSSNTIANNSLILGLPLGYILIAVGAVFLTFPLLYLFKSKEQ